MHLKSQPSGDQPPRCAACHDVIGVYEPVVHVFKGLVWRTSRAAEPGVGTAAGERYHLGCYEHMEDKPAPSA